MKQLFWVLVCSAVPFLSIAQNETQSYGKVNQADLELKECPFEKDAHAMVLFDKGDIYFDDQFDIVLERHKRLKIFDEKATHEANIRIEFNSYNRFEDVYNISAETINYKDGKPVITKLDRKQIFREAIDKYRTAIVFSLPDVQPGSVIEYKYTWKTVSYSIPTWYFQSKLPERYSELSTAIPDIFYYKTQYRAGVPYKTKTSAESKFLQGTGYTVNKKLYALQNVPSLADEPFMTSRYDNLLSALFQLTRIQPIGGFTRTGSDTWEKVAGTLAEDEDFGLQFKKKLENEESIISKAKAMKTDDEKISFIFNEVKNSMKWNGSDQWYTADGISKAWQKKTGNSTEINLILYRLLKQSAVKNAYPMIVSTRENGKVNMAYPWLYQFNRTVVNISVDSTKRYILDASNKYQLYNTYPISILNSFGLSIDRENKTYKIVEISMNQPARKNIFINAEIKPEGKMSGTASLVCFSYHKMDAVETFKSEGEEKYKQRLTDKDNSLKIKAFTMEAADVDSLPLQEKIDFDLELTGSDDNYIYFSPNLFTSLKKNPFLSENRTTTIDFGYNNKYALTGIYKLPAGYKVDALPKNLTMVMPDKSISFQRIVLENEGNINVRYVIDFKKSVYSTEEYPMIWQFYKQVFEMLNEQIILKKS